MNSELWQQVNQLFHSALRCAPLERATFLDDACAGNVELRERVERLLSAYQQAGSFMEHPALEVEARASASTLSSHAITDSLNSRYEVRYRLGAGGMGEVYLAKDVVMGREVAIKFLSPHFTTDPERVRRFQQEVRALSALNHPNILMPYDSGQLDSVQYMVTEFVEGVSLRQRMVSNSMPVNESIELAMQIAGALAAAHSKGIVHRDIKPENIMVKSSSDLNLAENQVKVLDFGIAKLVDTEEIETEVPTRPLVSTTGNDAVGTVPYMSPEQARGLKVDARTDIWSLGVVLYEMLAGRRPFTGETNTDLIVSILEKEPPRFSSDAQIPTALEQIVDKALRKNKDERYQTVKHLHGELKDLHDSLKHAGGHFVTTTRSTQTLKAKQKWLRALRISVFLALIALVVVAIVIRSTPKPKKHIPFLRFKMQPLTFNGKASFAAISPDGKEVAHVTGPIDRRSLNLLNVATNNDPEIVASNGGDIKSVSFSRDGHSIYFVRTQPDGLVLYAVSIQGGPPKPIVRDIQTAAAFSPDDKRLAFVRSDPQHGEASLIVANVDGSDEKKVITHRMDEFFFSNLVTTPAWSRDGERIAIALRGSGSGGRYRNVTTVNLKDKEEKQISFEKWNTIHSISWLPKDEGLLISAIDPQRQNTQLWHISYPDGAAQQLTTEMNNYSDVSVAGEGRLAVTVRSEGTSDVWVVPTNHRSRASQITFNRFDGPPGMDWTPDNKIVHGSNRSGNRDLWLTNADGSNERKLTSNMGLNLQPSVSADGRYIVFQSDRTGSMNIWRMDTDGLNQKQLTHGSYDVDARCTKDNQVIFYSNTNNIASVWKVDIDGGNPVRLVNYPSSTESASLKNGNNVLRFEDDHVTPKRWRYGVFSPDGGDPLNVFDFPTFWESIGPGFYGQNVRWTADGIALTYVENKDGVSNIWAQPVNGGPRRQLTQFTSDLIFFYALSRDGKNIAVARGSKVSDVVLMIDLDDTQQ